MSTQIKKKNSLGIDKVKSLVLLVKKKKSKQFFLLKSVFSLKTGILQKRLN